MFEFYVGGYYKITSFRIVQLEEENKKLTTVYELRIASMQQEMAQKEEKIRLLEDEILRLHARLNTDGTNSSLPTSIYKIQGARKNLGPLWVGQIAG